MKYFLYIFTYLLLGASCSSPSRPIDYGTELTATDSICLSIDEHTHYESKSIFQFEENGHEYLSFLNEKASYKVHIYDLDTKQVIKTIHLQKEGRNAMPSTNGCFPLSSKHFLITTWNGVFGIINEKGEVENKNSFWKDSVNFHAFDHICCMSYTYRPAIIKDSILYFSQSLLKYPRKKDEWDKIPIFAYADLHKKKLGWTELRYPSIFNKDEIDYILYDPEISYTYTGKEVVVSLGQYDSIFVSSNFKHKKAYNAKSHYLPHVRPVSQNLQIDLFKTIHDRGLQPHYHHLMYDKYRKVFYRFALMPDDNIKPFSNNPHQSFSIIILNKDYEIIGETKFPGNTYAHHLCFVGKKGLYISENNENNPQFDRKQTGIQVFHTSRPEKMKKKNYSIILCGGLFLASCMSNNDKCLQKLFDEVGVEKSQIHNATHLVTILGNGCKGCIHKALSEIHNSTDTIYIIACKSKKTFNLIANKNIDDYSNVYLDTKSILVELDMAKNTPRVYLLNNGKYVSHSFYGNESPSKEANTTITFNTNEIDLGKISRTEKARIKFTIWNTGKNIVRISHIDLSCECLNIENEITEINPGDSTCLNIIFHPDDIGKFQREILLYGNFDSSPKLLTITGECF